MRLESKIETFFCVLEIEHQPNGDIDLVGYRRYCFRPDVDFAYALQMIPSVLMNDYGTTLPVPAIGEARGNLQDKDKHGNLVLPPVVYGETYGDYSAIIVPILQNDSDGKVTQVTKILLERAGGVVGRVKSGSHNLMPSLN